MQLEPRGIEYDGSGDPSARNACGNSVSRGNGDYAAMQFGSLLLIVLLISLFPSRCTRGGDLWGAFGLYALAKVAEHYDYPILAATGGVVSGHTLKHLIAAAAMAWLVRMLVLRRAAAPSQSGIAAG